MWEGVFMGEGRQVLIVNLSGDQKKVLGYASWTQISITGAGIILGALVFKLIQWICKLSGAGLGSSTTIAGLFFLAVVGPFVYVAFKPVRDKQGDLLYYENKQIMINRRFLTLEIGTYLNLQPPHHPVNRALPYADLDREEEKDL